MFSVEYVSERLHLLYANAKTQVWISLAAVLCILIAEIVILGYRKSSTANILSQDRSARKDLLSYILDVSGVLRIIGHVMTLGGGYLFGQLINKSLLNINLAGSLANPAVQIAFFLIGKSFFDYWLHRFMHTIPVLWEIHKYHHSTAEMNIVPAHRESVLVAPWSSLYFAIPLGILGAPTTTFLLLGFLIELHALLIHSQLKFTWGRVGEYFLISPLAHRTHYSIALEHWDKIMDSCFRFGIISLALITWIMCANRLRSVLTTPPITT
ncbi:sterol desaturase family protein [Collimonas sp.]|jgi:sterol desaturase/sphingolipid hydroxylase (fatty acid hydroxylase superfamily)|uniref:sterol desaturase family protein n=1 Tax=Collimonas sp. TaxID=1963772 RepID=UPI002C508515|nr:sterol desaturase family protein [Collimonas sp.]HWW06117.1 sterol desaturase family protein [Collimonas sp.]